MSASRAAARCLLLLLAGVYVLAQAAAAGGAPPPATLFKVGARGPVGPAANGTQTWRAWPSPLRRQGGCRENEELLRQIEVRPGDRQLQSCAAGDDSDCSCYCKPGFFRGGATSCEACPRGTVTTPDSRDDSCEQCPPGKYSDVTAATSLDQCRPCAPPATTTADLSACVSACPAGQFSDRPGKCLGCPSGKFSAEEGASACADCAEGTSSGAHFAAACELCPAGTYVTQGAGYQRLTDARAYPPEPLFGWKWMHQDLERCQVWCDAWPQCGAIVQSEWGDCGLFAKVVGRPTGQSSHGTGERLFYQRTNCRSCDGGKYSGKAGETSEAACVGCTAGSYSEVGSTSCTKCPSGKFLPHDGGSGERACEPCAAGKFSNASGATSAASCQQCRPGKFTPAAKASVSCYDLSHLLESFNQESTGDPCGCRFQERPGSSAPASSGSMTASAAPYESLCFWSIKYEGNVQSDCSNTMPCPTGTFCEIDDQGDVPQGHCSSCPWDQDCRDFLDVANVGESNVAACAAACDTWTVALSTSLTFESFDTSKTMSCLAPPEARWGGHPDVSFPLMTQQSDSGNQTDVSDTVTVFGGVQERSTEGYQVFTADRVLAVLAGRLQPNAATFTTTGELGVLFHARSRRASSGFKARWSVASAGAASCEDCPAGTYSGQFGAVGFRTSCSFCQVGKYSNTPAAVQCDDCPAGKFSSSGLGEKDSMACVHCPPDTFLEATGASEVVHELASFTCSDGCLKDDSDGIALVKHGRPIRLDGGADFSAPYTCTCILAVTSAPTHVGFRLEIEGLVNVTIRSCETRACTSPLQLYPSVGAASTQGEVCDSSKATETQCRQEACCKWQNGCQPATSPGDACMSPVEGVLDEEDEFCQNLKFDECEQTTGCCQWEPSSGTCSAPHGKRCKVQMRTRDTDSRPADNGLYTQFLEVRMQAASLQSLALFDWETIPVPKSNPCRACPEGQSAGEGSKTPADCVDPVSSQSWVVLAVVLPILACCCCAAGVGVYWWSKRKARPFGDMNEEEKQAERKKRADQARRRCGVRMQEFEERFKASEARKQRAAERAGRHEERCIAAESAARSPAAASATDRVVVPASSTVDGVRGDVVLMQGSGSSRAFCSPADFAPSPGAADLEAGRWARYGGETQKAPRLRQVVRRVMMQQRFLRAVVIEEEGKFEAAELRLGKSEDSVLKTFIGLEDSELTALFADPMGALEREWYPFGFYELGREPADNVDTEFTQGLEAANQRHAADELTASQLAEEVERLQDALDERKYKWWLAGANFDYVVYGEVGSATWLPPQVSHSFETGKYHGGDILASDYDTGFYDTPALELYLQLSLNDPQVGHEDDKGVEDKARKRFKTLLAHDLAVAASSSLEPDRLRTRDACSGLGKKAASSGAHDISETDIPIIRVQAAADGGLAVTFQVLPDLIAGRGPDDCWKMAQDLCFQATQQGSPLLQGAITCKSCSVQLRRERTRQGATLATFVAHEASEIAGLKDYEAAAVRLYTSDAYPFFNGPMRQRIKPHPLKFTMYFLDEGLTKLRTVDARLRPHAYNKVKFLWRGMRNMTLDADKFMEDGGSELAPMSTTEDLNIAVKYSASQCPLIFRFEARGRARGVEIAFLSLYPKEKEYLYAPLTGLILLRVNKVTSDEVMTLGEVDQGVKASAKASDRGDRLRTQLRSIQDEIDALERQKQHASNGGQPLVSVFDVRPMKGGRGAGRGGGSGKERRRRRRRRRVY